MADRLAMFKAIDYTLNFLPREKALASLQSMLRRPDLEPLVRERAEEAMGQLQDSVVTWRTLVTDLNAYSVHYDAELLDILLRDWDRYWRASWGGRCPTVNSLLDLFDRAIAMLEVKEQGAAVLYRVDNLISFVELAKRIRQHILYNGPVVINSNLSGRSVEGMVHRLLRQADNERARALASIVLCCRLILALETFCRLPAFGLWTKPEQDPSEIEVIVSRSHSAVRLARLTGIIGDTPGNGI